MQHIAYNRSVFQEGWSLDDFANHCRFILSKTYNIPFKSPVFDSYLREDFIIEYFSLIYASNESQRDIFENQLVKLGIIERKKDVIDWLEEMTEKENQSIKAEIETAPDAIAYTPGDSE